MPDILSQLGISLPIVQAPMAGISTAALAAAVSNAGGLGSVGIGNLNVEAARQLIVDVRAATDRPFNVNVFCHRPAVADAAREAAWLATLAPEFAKFGARPPAVLREIYTSFTVDDAMLAMLVAERPAVVSFHFGLPQPAAIRALKSVGITLFATATNLAEARTIDEAGIDAIVAQGYEAGGHRGVFDPTADEACLGAMELTRLLVSSIGRPVITAGGIMDGAGIAAALNLGASAAQLGTAFLLCPEAATDVGYRAALTSDAAAHTTMTSAISGRTARSLANRFTALGAIVDQRAIPEYPIAYDAAKALHAAAVAKGEYGYGAQWAGQGAPQVRALPAQELMTVLERELTEAQSNARRKFGERSV